MAEGGLKVVAEHLQYATCLEFARFVLAISKTAPSWLEKRKPILTPLSQN